MKARPLLILSIAAAAATSPTLAQSPGDLGPPERAIRRDIPLTNMIRRAFAAGTRDSTGRPGPNYWQLWIDYHIQAKLDPATHAVTGTETAVIHNTSPEPMENIVLRLDQNIFAPNAVRLRPVPEITDGMAITRMTVNGEPVDLNPPPRRFRRGGEPPEVRLAAYGTGQTSANITLPTPIPAKGEATIEVERSFRVPHARGMRGLRMGAWGDTLVQIAQWYPRVAVFDDLRGGGWDTEPYLGPSEFYNNFGSFDVTIEVPAGWIVGATGVLQNPDEVLTEAARERLSHVLESDSTRTIVGAEERGPSRATAAGERLRWHFVADTVGDFAWAASDRYVWDATRATIPGGGRIPVHIMYLPGNAEQYREAGPIARHALEFYSGLWMPYAFPQLTMVDGPDRGMEYPMFIMSGVGAADHEVGHEWWPMMVGVNETWYGFMDEGFNVYMNRLSRAHLSGEEPDLDGMGQSYGQISGDEREAPLMWNANYGGPMYRFQAYSKAPLMLSMLGGIVGDTAVWRAMSEYARAWRFKHPTPWDYAFFMNNALGTDLSWFWYYWLFTTESVDGSIQQVATDGSRTTVTVRQDGEMPSPVVLEVRFASEGPPIAPIENGVMVDAVTALVTYPVDVWFSGKRTFEATLDFGPRKIERILLDPKCRFPDRDVTDNVWPRDPSFGTQGAPGVAGCYGR
ncbi:MAG: M1 family metallopeptidase [Gemmatimonadales bacterium]